MLCLVAIGASTTAQARDLVTTSLVDQLKNESHLEDLRVYVNRKVVAKYSKTTENSSNTNNGNYNAVNRKEVLRDVVDHFVRGKIIDSETNEYGYHLYVSFNQACETRACAFSFLAYSDSDSYSLNDAPATSGDKTLTDTNWRGKTNSEYVYLQYKKRELNRTITKTQHERGF